MNKEIKFGNNKLTLDTDNPRFYGTLQKENYAQMYKKTLELFDVIRDKITNADILDKLEGEFIAECIKRHKIHPHNVQFTDPVWKKDHK